MQGNQPDPLEALVELVTFYLAHSLAVSSLTLPLPFQIFLPKQKQNKTRRKKKSVTTSTSPTSLTLSSHSWTPHRFGRSERCCCFVNRDVIKRKASPQSACQSGGEFGPEPSEDFRAAPENLGSSLTAAKSSLGVISLSAGFFFARPWCLKFITNSGDWFWLDADIQHTHIYIG